MVVFTGDINLTDSYFDSGFGIGSKLIQGFNPVSHIVKREGECWVGNFEGVAANVTNKIGTAANHFRVAPQFLQHLGLIDVWSLANNHAMQHGAVAYQQTIVALENKGCLVFGTKQDHSTVMEHQGKIVSLTGFSQRIDSWEDEPAYWHNPEYREIEEELKLLPEGAFNVAYVHWGNEFINYPSSQQKRFAHWLVDAGFDLVVGMHPHVLQGYEVYRGKYIFYSIGNFVFDMAWEPTHYGAIVNVDFSNGEPEISYDYVKIGDDYSPRVVDEADVPLSYRFEELNKLVAIDENSEEYHIAINKYYHQYRRANHQDILKKMVHHPSVALGIIRDYIRRKI